MATITPEEVARKVITIWTDNYAASLTTVQANWAATEDITLRDFVVREISASPDIMQKNWEFPAMQVGIGPMAESAAPNIQQYVSAYDLQVRIFYYLKAPDARRLALILLRHIEATLSMLENFPALDFGPNGKMAPNTLTFTPSNTAPLGTNALVKGLMISFDFRITQSGF
jgi:hypothetical protein